MISKNIINKQNIFIEYHKQKSTVHSVLFF